MFNITDKIDFESKLTDGLSAIEGVNISEQFGKVVTPLEDIQVMVDSISKKGIENLNIATTINQPMCPFNDTYTINTIFKPWEANIKKDTTPWILNSSGEVGLYSRLGTESSIEYISRIYDTAGICSGSNSCCLNNVCNQPLKQPCNSGE